MDIKERLVTGIAHVSDVTQINVEAKQGQMNMQEEVFRAMANEQISVDFINISPNNVVYTVKDQLAEKAEKILIDKGYESSTVKEIVPKSQLSVLVLLVFQVLLPKSFQHFQSKVFVYYNQLIVIQPFGC